MTTALGNTLNLSYDTLRRLSSVSLGSLSRQYLYRDISDTQTTTQVATVRYPVPGTSQNYDFNYTYDTQGNVTGCSLLDGTTVDHGAETIHKSARKNKENPNGYLSLLQLSEIST